MEAAGGGRAGPAAHQGSTGSPLGLGGGPVPAVTATAHDAESTKVPSVTVTLTRYVPTAPSLTATEDALPPTTAPLTRHSYVSTSPSGSVAMTGIVRASPGAGGGG